MIGKRPRPARKAPTVQNIINKATRGKTGGMSVKPTGTVRRRRK